MICLMGFLFAGAEAPVVWLEAEHFTEKGGWVDDAQFVDLVGSPYLLACGVGRPVADAVTTARVPAAGEYRLWVRCRDWIPGQAPGKFQVLVNGRPSPAPFGAAAADAWQWVDGGAFTLPAGEVEVRLRDLTGWWGRCDAVVLTRGERPADDPAALARQREQFGGVSAAVDRKGPYDLVVVGGGLGGCAAAVAAARHGCRVALVQDRPVLGGNASSEIRVGASGDTSGEPLDPRETGIIEELEPPGAKGERSERYESVIRGQPGIELLLNTRAMGVRTAEGKRIAAVTAMDVQTGQRVEIAGRLFADCTGDGWIGFWAGADYRHGREGRAEYDEPAAPAVADTNTLSTSLTQCTIVTRDEPAPFAAPAWAPTWKSCDDFDPKPKVTVHSNGDLPPEGWHEMQPGKGRHPDTADAIRGTWWLELGGVRDTLADAERIRDDLFRLKLGLWDHVKNHCEKYREANANRELVWQSHIAGKRESRRLLGDYVMSQRDYMERKVHPDTVLYAGYNIDPHHPLGFWADGPQAFRLYHHKVSVPYRILYSRSVENLFMAGRNVSATHLAMNGVRVMRTTCVMGQVVGTAAGIAHRHETTPRGVYQRHLKELQQELLRDGCYLMGVRNEDPEDLALGAAVTASSHALVEEAGGGEVALLPGNVKNGWNRAVQGEPNAWGPAADPHPPTPSPTLRERGSQNPNPPAPRTRGEQAAPPAPRTRGEQAGPHWIELRFARPVSIESVYVTFQLPGVATAKGYDLAVPDGDGWRTVCSARGNTLRRRVDRLDGARSDRVRLTLAGDDAQTRQVRICEIRVYGK